MKQPDSALNGFCKAAESFPAPVIASLLLSKLNEEIPFVSKAVKNFSYNFFPNLHIRESSFYLKLLSRKSRNITIISTTILKFFANLISPMKA